MVLFKSVVEVATRPVAYLPGEFSSDRLGYASWPSVVTRVGGGENPRVNGDESVLKSPIVFA
jgi:hypothetical protein